MTRTYDFDRNQSSAPSPSRLYRDRDNGILAGVCSGVARYFGIQPWHVRLAVIVGLFFFAPPVAIGYVILALMLPNAPDRLFKSEADERFWRDVRVDPGQKFSELKHRFRELEHRLRSIESYVTSDAYRVHKEINDL